MMQQMESEPTIAYPPRYWWLKRITVGTCILLAILTLARLVWGWDAIRRLNAEIAAIRARGEPFLPKEFNVPVVDDNERNAAYHLRLAMAAMNPNVDSPRASNNEYPDYLPLPAEWYTGAAAAIAANQPVYAHARRARQSIQVDWGIDWATEFKNPGRLTSIGGLTQARQLAYLLADSAQMRHLSGNDAEAIELLMDLFAISSAVDQQPMLVSHLVAMGIDAVGCVPLQIIAPAISIDGERSKSEATKPVRRDRIEALIVQLLDQDRRDTLRLALIAERTYAMSAMEMYTTDSVLLKPMHQIVAGRLLAKNYRLIGLSTQPSFAEPLPTRIASRDGRISRSVSDVLMTPLDRVVENDFRVRMERTMAAVSLATRLYRLDHNDQFPDNLESLVPRYLPALPIDPLSPDARPLRYVRARNGTRPLVYSVGESRTTSPLDESTIPPEPQYTWSLMTTHQLRDLSRLDPPAPATTPADQE